MRTITGNGITISYPDKVGFVFNPCLIKIEGEKMSAIQFAVTGNNRSVSLLYDAYQGKCIINMQEYLKTLFFSENIANIDYSSKDAQVSDMAIPCSISIVVRDSNSTALYSLNFKTLYVWGAMRPTDTFNALKHLTWFCNYPFSFGLYTNKAGTIAIKSDDGLTRLIDVSADAAIRDVTSANFHKQMGTIHIMDTGSIVEQATFDATFDLTFIAPIATTPNEILTIDIDDSDSGIYLRWVDRHGFYRYWLFVEGIESRAVSTNGEYIRNDLWNWDDTFGYLGINGRRQGYTREDTIAICAPHVDSTIFDMLQDIATSPIVDMWTGSNWISVSVKPGTYTKTNLTYQDFEANIIRNDIPLQSL